ncbi:heterodimeric geranylgeranyl pyrophosphate synthase small subunit, chloroplastic-like [Lycium ferocissimum]|uniref:heterodimeric geranylgeranyl pyrophosphate synthase small subunit, chloroplastic-like n=1 Tax=Lycium ferocissimum TaxID=112874 RepID=UPI002815EA52|nr:heterodimeric geranylgeranyl pyrophosphate synthase small subunit, chloroplastic-like [Lycium ferocissimum]
MARVFSFINGSTSLSTQLSCSSSSSCYRPMVVRMCQNQSYWASIESDIEAHLKKAITIRPPESVFEPMHYLTFATPKSTAPALCIAACELVGGDRAQAMAAASAIHLMHVVTYTHQHMQSTLKESGPGPESILGARSAIGHKKIDVELQDEDVSPARKNSNEILRSTGPELEPAKGHKFGPNIELLTGDGIMPFAIELLAKDMSPARNNSDKILRVITEVTRAIGSQGMLEGQYREIEWARSGNGNEKLLEYACKKKEGEIHACGAVCGAILGDGSEEEVESLRKYGLYVGIIQGIINGVGRNYNKTMEKRVDELRVLAMKELNTSFKGKKLVRPIARLVEEFFVPLKM